MITGDTLSGEGSKSGIDEDYNIPNNARSMSQPVRSAERSPYPLRIGGKEGEIAWKKKPRRRKNRGRGRKAPQAEDLVQKMSASGSLRQAKCLRNRQPFSVTGA